MRDDVRKVSDFLTPERGIVSYRLDHFKIAGTRVLYSYEGPDHEIIKGRWSPMRAGNLLRLWMTLSK